MAKEPWKTELSLWDQEHAQKNTAGGQKEEGGKTTSGYGAVALVWRSTERRDVREKEAMCGLIHGASKRREPSCMGVHGKRKGDARGKGSNVWAHTWGI